MDTLIVYLDDAAYAEHIIAPMLNDTAATRWVLVACAPRMSRRIGKWLSHTSRENWRDKWCDKLFAQITSKLQTQQSDTQVLLEYVVAKGPLPDLVQQLRSHFGAVRIVDARRPKCDPGTAPVATEQQHELLRWQTPGIVG